MITSNKFSNLINIFLLIMTLTTLFTLIWFLKNGHMVSVDLSNMKYLSDNNQKSLAIDNDRGTSRRIVNTIITDYKTGILEKFQQTIDLKSAARDPLVIEVVTEMLDAPSNHIPKNSRKVVHTGQSQYVADTLFKKKRNGFFIECGALDGERSSNTIWLEQNFMWSGLLIEADPYFYTQLLGKNRKSWSINACLSPYNHTSWLTFSESIFGQGAILEENSDQSRVSKFKEKEVLNVPCFPLESLLAALNRTTVDYFSLDVEGSELSILESIPHSRLNIMSWTIEYDKVGEEQLQSFMESNGYETVEKIVEVKPEIHLYSRDLVFTRKS